MQEIIVVLVNVRSLHNVGSIFRTADAAGVSKLYLCGITPTPTTKLGDPRGQVTKVSLGAEHTVPWEQVTSIAALLTRFKKDGYTICAVEQSPRSTPYIKISVSYKKIALVFGNEVTGLPPAVLRVADVVAEIPMYGKKESLNVSVAAGIVLFGMRAKEKPRLHRGRN